MAVQRRQILHLLSGVATLSALPRSVLAQAYPTHPIRLIVGFPAGGQVDIVARLAGQALGEQIGQTVVVENKPGAGGNLGAQAVIGAAPDGYTLFVGTAANAVNTTLFTDLPYDFPRDITPVAPINRIPLILTVNPGFHANDVAEFLANAKANPGKVIVASPSAGTPPYLCVDLLRMMADVDIVHVPYFGENQMMTDLLGGQVLAAFGGISTAIAHLKAGKLRALGVTTAQRVPELADVPTIGETVPGFEASGWIGVVGPKGMPWEIVARLAGAIRHLQLDPTFKARLSEFGLALLAMNSDEFGKFIIDEAVKWGKVVKFAGLKPQ